jgi:hypothetical protein
MVGCGHIRYTNKNQEYEVMWLAKRQDQPSLLINL